MCCNFLNLTISCSDDDTDDEKTDEVVFVSSTPAIISSSDSEDEDDDDDIVVIAHTTGRKNPAPPPPTPPTTGGSKTEEAVQSILSSATNSDKSKTCTTPSDTTFTSSGDKSAGRAEDEDEILKAIRSITSGLQENTCGMASGSGGGVSTTAASSLNTASSSADYLLNDDPFGTSDFSLDLGSFSGQHPWSDMAHSVGDSNKPSDVVTCGDNSDSKSGGRGGKSSLKRSLSSGCTSSSSIPLKKRPLYATALSTSDLCSMEAGAGASETVECLTCLVNFDNAKLSKCILGHPCCSECLQKRAKRILAQERKVCIFSLSFFPGKYSANGKSREGTIPTFMVQNLSTGN